MNDISKEVIKKATRWGRKDQGRLSLPFGDITIWHDRALLSVSKVLRMNLKT